MDTAFRVRRRSVAGDDRSMRAVLVEKLCRARAVAGVEPVFERVDRCPVGRLERADPEVLVTARVVYDDDRVVAMLLRVSRIVGAVGMSAATLVLIAVVAVAHGEGNP